MPITLGLYDVVVASTAAAQRCKLETLKPDLYRLQFVDDGIILTEKAVTEERISWNHLYNLRYDYIRRYGKRTNVFIIEAGRSCDTGEGEFRFQSPESEKMFNLFRSTTEDILQRQCIHRENVERGIDVPSLVEETGHSINETKPAPPGPDNITKDDSHIYSQVQKKRAAPNIPPRGNSLRNPNSASVNNGRPLPIATSEPAVAVEKREPIYTELMDLTGSVPANSSHNGRCEHNLKAKARCRSPAPLTDNFIRHNYATQYATVVDVLSPNTTKLAQEKIFVLNGNDMEAPSQHDMPLKSDNNPILPSSSNISDKKCSSLTSDKMSVTATSNQKKKSKFKLNSRKKGANDENKQSSSWFNFFGHKK